MNTTLTTAEAAARLGIRPETLYAYVSRGLIESHRVRGSRESRFELSDVERLAARSRAGGRAGALEIVIDTELTLIDPAGRLWYRGHDVVELCGEATYEQVADWLFTGTWQDTAPWEPRDEALDVARAAAALSPAGARPVDRLRTVVAALAPVDPLRHDRRPEAVAGVARSLVATLVDCLPDVTDTPDSPDLPDTPDMPNAPTVSDGRAGLGPRSLATRLWPKLSPAPAGPDQLATLNAAMVLLADHELAAATLAARVAASTWADPYLVILAGLAALGGPLHGGASEQLVRLLEEADERGSSVVIGERLGLGDRIPGVGHKVYTGSDPRAVELLARVEAAWSDSPRLAAPIEIRRIMAERGAPHPNIDFGLAALSRAGEMVPGAGEAIFATARCAGFLAHAIEEYQHRLRFRPRAAYTGVRPQTSG